MGSMIFRFVVNICVILVPTIVNRRNFSMRFIWMGKTRQWVIPWEQKVSFSCQKWNSWPFEDSLIFGQSGSFEPDPAFVTLQESRLILSYFGFCGTWYTKTKLLRKGRKSTIRIGIVINKSVSGLAGELSLQKQMTFVQWRQEFLIISGKIIFVKN